MGKKGVALILALGVLSILAIVATSFSVNMRLEYKASVNFANTIRAKYASEAGIAAAMDALRAKTRTSFSDTTDGAFVNGGINYNWRTVPNTPVSASDLNVTYSYDVTDCASKINVNMGDKEALYRIIVNLATILNLSNIEEIGKVISGKEYNSGSGAYDPVTNHAPSGGYCSLQELKIVYLDNDSDGKRSAGDFGLTTEPDDTDLYDALAPFLTIAGITDPRCNNRTPVNVNTATLQVLQAVLDGLVPGETSAPFTKADAIAAQIVSGRPFDTFSDLWASINATAGVSLAEKEAVWNSINPYLNLSSFPVWVMAGGESWPVAAAPIKNTEFCLTSAGYYDITSTGEVRKITGSANPDATYKINAIVKISDLVYHTTKDDFEGAPPATEPKAFRCTTFNSCPMGPIFDDTAWQAKKCYDAVKIGFWDNFDDQNEKFYDSNSAWLDDPLVINQHRLAMWKSAGEGNLRIGNYDATDNDNEIYTEPDSIHWYLRGWLVGASGAASPFVPIPYTLSTATPNACFDWMEYTMRAEIKDAVGPRDVPDPVVNHTTPPISSSKWPPFTANLFQGPRCMDGGLWWGTPPSSHSEGMYSGNPWDAQPNCDNEGIYSANTDDDPNCFDNHDGGTSQEFPANNYVVTLLNFNGTEASSYGWRQMRGEWDRIWKAYAGTVGEGSDGGSYIFGSGIGGAAWDSSPYFVKKRIALTSCNNDSSAQARMWFFMNPYNVNTSTWSSWSKVAAGGGGGIITRSKNTHGAVGFLTNNEVGFFRAWQQTGTLDDLRIIPGSPGSDYDAPYTAPAPILSRFSYFESKLMNIPGLAVGGTVNWGAINGTVTLTTPANFNFEKVLFQASSDNGTNWFPALGNALIDNNSAIPSTVVASPYIKYRALFINEKDPKHQPIAGGEGNVTPSNSYYSDTIALEDVTITYLPKTQIVFYKEAVE